jgi:hypothetical protein
MVCYAGVPSPAASVSGRKAGGPLAVRTAGIGVGATGIAGQHIEMGTAPLAREVAQAIGGDPAMASIRLIGPAVAMGAVAFGLPRVFNRRRSVAERHGVGLRRFGRRCEDTARVKRGRLRNDIGRTVRLREERRMSSNYLFELAWAASDTRRLRHPSLRDEDCGGTAGIHTTGADPPRRFGSLEFVSFNPLIAYSRLLRILRRAGDIRICQKLPTSFILSDRTM